MLSNMGGVNLEQKYLFYQVWKAADDNIFSLLRNANEFVIHLKFAEFQRSAATVVVNRKRSLLPDAWSHVNIVHPSISYSW